MNLLHVLKSKRKEPSPRRFRVPLCSCCSCFLPFSPQFYQTHTPEEVDAATDELIDEMQRLLEESRRKPEDV